MRSIIIAAVFAAFAAAPAFAAQDGTEGATSTGSVTVTANIAAPPPIIALITGLADLSLGDITGATSQIQAEDPVCIYHTSPTVRIRITSPTDFELRNGAGQSILAGIAIAQGGQILAVASGNASPAATAGISGIVANRQSPSCAEGPVQEVIAGTLGSVDPGLPAGAYSGAFQIIVAVE